MSRQIKTIGIVGGLGPESTIEYYRQIIARYREQISDGSYPPIIIHSMDVRELFRQCGANEFGKVRDSIVESIQSLARAGAQFGLIASNTPHIVFDDICQRSPLPLLSIVEATRAEAKARGLSRLALSGLNLPCKEIFIGRRLQRQTLLSSLRISPTKNIFMRNTRLNSLTGPSPKERGGVCLKLSNACTVARESRV